MAPVDPLHALYERHMRGLNRSAYTIARRRQSLGQLTAWLNGRPLSEATTDDLEAWRDTIELPATRAAYQADLTAFYRWAHRRGHIDHDPTAALELVSTPKALPKPVTVDLTPALTTGRKRARLAVALALYAGLRASEIAALHGHDLIRTDRPLVVVRDGKGGKDRTIPMHPRLAVMLANVPATGPVFPGRRGQPVSGQTMSSMIAGHLRRCGVEATAHRLRHTFGTEAARRSNGNLLAVAAMMGHESTQTTRKYVGWSGESAELVESMFPEYGAP